MLQQSSEDLKRSFGTLVNVIDVRQAPRKRVAHSIGVFRARVIKAFFFFFSRIHSGDIEKDATCSPGSWQFQFAQGRTRVTAENTQLYSRGHSAGYHLIVRCMCLIGNCRGQTLNESMPGSIQNAVHFPDTHSSHCLSSGLLLNEI